MNRMRKLAALVVVTLGFVMPLALPAGSAHAYDVFQRACANGGGGAACSTSNANPIPKAINGAISVVTFVGSIVSVIFIIIGGFKYILAGGDASNTASAKNTILYALVGLIILLTARVIVGFVVGKIA